MNAMVQWCIIFEKYLGYKNQMNSSRIYLLFYFCRGVYLLNFLFKSFMHQKIVQLDLYRIFSRNLIIFTETIC